MTQTMTLQFTRQDYQAQAVDAVVKVFSGQLPAGNDFALAGQSVGVAHAGDGSIGNALVLSRDQLLANVQAVQKANGLEASAALVASASDNGEQVYCPLNFSIEMETGTGKTYTFIRTLYELNKTYGFRKFVVVVPSVAIREGTMKNPLNSVFW